MNILCLTSSLFGADGKSSTLADHSIAKIKSDYPSAKLVVRDLAAAPLPHLDAPRLTAHMTPPEERSSEQAELAQLGDALIAELQACDLLILAVPMYNFGVPSTLKAWVDYVARAGVTFRYTANGPEGLIENTKALILGARGGEYWGTPLDSQTPFLTTFLNFLGINEIEFVMVEKLNLYPDQAADFLAAGKAQIEALLPSYFAD